MKYKIGDKVRIRKDLKRGMCYGGKNINSDGGMDGYIGTAMTVIDCIKDYYKMKEDGGEWGWTGEMIEGLVKKRTGPKSWRIVTWDTKCGDPFRVFEYKDEAMKFINEVLMTDDNVIKASIRVYECKAPKKIDYKVTLVKA